MIKPVSEFYKKLNGLQSQCKVCTNYNSRAYRSKHAARLRKIAKENYIKNRRRRIALATKWNKSNPKKRSRIMVFQNAKRRARKMSNGLCDLTPNQWRLSKQLAGGNCVYCGKKSRLSQDHFIPLSRGGFHTVSNIVPSCMSCNGDKSNKPPYLWVLKKFGRSGLKRLLEFNRKVNSEIRVQPKDLCTMDTVELIKRCLNL